MQKTIFKKSYVVPVDVNIMGVFGLEKAYILQQIHYWIEVEKEKAKEDKQDRHYQDGRWWIYNTYQDWQKQFSFCSLRKLKTVFKELKDDGVLLVAHYNLKGYDKTNWYSIDYEHLEAIIKVQGAEFAHVKSANVSSTECKDCTTYTKDIQTKNTNKDYNISSDLKKQSPMLISEKADKWQWKSTEQYNDYLNKILPEYIQDYILDTKGTEQEYTECYKHIKDFFDTYKQHKGKYHPWYKKELIYKVCQSITTNYQDDCEFDNFMKDFFNKQTDKHNYTLSVFVNEEWIKMSRAIDSEQYFDFKETKIGKKHNVVSYDEYMKQKEKEEWEEFLKEN